MSHAIVIGIDEYEQPEWNLAGARRDALRFAHWALTTEGVAPDDLHLHLAPLPDEAEVAHVLGVEPTTAAILADRAAPADQATIGRLLHEYRRKKKGEGADRLWFFYAGHGLAPPAKAPEAGPIIVPTDIDDLGFYLDNAPIEIEIFRQVMQNEPPAEQCFFVDACRGVVSVAGPATLTSTPFWMPRGGPGQPVAGLAAQVALYATSLGELAVEVRDKGIFTEALLAGLRGEGPFLTPPALDGDRWQLTFPALVEYVRWAVADGLEQTWGSGGTKPVQTPHDASLRAGNLPLAHFAHEQLREFAFSAFVEPDAALAAATLSVLRMSDDESGWVARTQPPPVGPGLPVPATFSVRAGEYPIKVEAPGYRPWSQHVKLYGDKRIPVVLEALAAADDEAVIDLRVAGDDAHAGPRAAGTGSLELHAQDSLARLTVVRGEKVIGGGYGHVTLPDLVPGPYRVVAELDGTVREDLAVAIEAGATSALSVVLPTDVPEGLQGPLGDGGMPVDPHGGADLAESFGTVAGTTPELVLASAAWAARWPDDGALHHLRRVGVDRIEPAADARGGVQVLVGSTTTDPAAFLDDVRIALTRPAERSTTPLATSGVPGLPNARQAASAVAAGTWALVLHLPDVTPVQLPVTVTDGVDLVVVVSQTADGSVEVLQLPVPQDPTVPMGRSDVPPSPDDVRHIDLMWRGLRDRLPIRLWEVEALGDRVRANPLLGALVVHRLLFAGRAADATDEATQEMRDLATTLVGRLREAFPTHPDIAMLDAVIGGDDARYDAALATGTPMIADVYRAGVAWLRKRAARTGEPQPELEQALLPDFVWTVFTQAEEETESVRTVSRTGRVARLRATSPGIVAAAGATCRLDATGGRHPLISTAVLIADDLVLCPLFSITLLPPTTAGGVPRLDPEQRAAVSFDPRGTGPSIPAVEAVTVVAPFGGPIVGDAPVVVLRLERGAGIEPTTLLSEQPPTGTPVAVVGFPNVDMRLPPQFGWTVTSSEMRKHVMTGVLVDVDPAVSQPFAGRVDHDALTSRGTGGGPIVLDDHEDDPLVAAVHLGGGWHDGRKRNYGVATAAFRRTALGDLARWT